MHGHVLAPVPTQPTHAHGIAAGCGKTRCLGAQICAGFDQASDLLQVDMGFVAPLSHLIAGPRPGFDNGHLPRSDAGAE